MRAPADDYYQRLGVSRTASAAELRRAYRLLALRFHPDRAGSASTELFQRLGEAYQVLSDAARRAAYDGGLGPVPGERQDGELFGPGAGIRIVWRTSRRRGPRIDRLSGPLPDLLARSAARRAADGAIELLLSAAEAAAGGVAAIAAPLPITCPTCAGVAAHNRVWCRRCEYAGQVVDDVVLLVDIPPGAADGTQCAFHDEAAGSVRVRVRVR